jgi:hypothetical protein
MADQLPTIRIPEQGYKGFAKLGALGPEKVRQLGEKLKQQPLTLDLDALVGRLAGDLGIPIADLEEVLYEVLTPVHTLRQRFALTPEQLVQVLTDSLQRYGEEEWKQQHLPGWQAVADALIPLLEPDTFLALLSKAFQLLGTRPATLTHLQILSELRPVYNEAATDLKALLLTNTLVIQYKVGGHERALHLSLDLDDLRMMDRELKRAHQKNGLAIERAGHWGVPLLPHGTMGD